MTTLKKIIYFGIIIEIFLAVYLKLNLSPEKTVIKYIIIYSIIFILTCSVFIGLRGKKISGRGIVLIIIFSSLFQFTMVFTQPDMSDDIYRYIWDGKVQYNGINPYRYAPSDRELSDLGTIELPSLINFPEIKTIYPPASQIFFLISFSIFGSSITGMKFLLVLISVLSIFIFYKLLKRFKKDLKLLLLFAWNPLEIMEVSVNGHIDILMVLFILLFFLFFFKGKIILSSIFFSLSVLTKLIPFFLIIPLTFTLYKRDKFKSILKFFIPFSVTTVLLYLPYIDHAVNMFKTAQNYSSFWYFNNPLFLGLVKFNHNNPLSHRIFFILFLISFIVITLLKQFDLKEKIFLTFLFLIIFNPTIHPWYLIIIIALIPLKHNKTILFWSFSIVFSYLVLYTFREMGIWVDSWWVMSIEYLPILGLIIFKSIKKREGK